MSSDISILNLIVDSGSVAKTVIAVLFVFSVISWAIMAERWRYFRRARAESRRFLAFFQTQRNLDQVYPVTSKWPHSPAAVVFREVYEKHRSVLSPTDSQVDPGGLASRPESVGQDLLEAVYRDLRLAAHREISRFEQRLPALATAGSVCPFLGLFGTVWGVMTAFLDISTKGSTNIVVVAPGIAEALITTIAGLAVAIPAMVAYNYFIQRARVLGLELEDMATAVMNILQLRGRNERV